MRYKDINRANEQIYKYESTQYRGIRNSLPKNTNAQIIQTTAMYFPLDSWQFVLGQTQKWMTWTFAYPLWGVILYSNHPPGPEQGKQMGMYAIDQDHLHAGQRWIKYQAVSATESKD